MSTREDLVRALVQLDSASFDDVINTAFRQRYDSTEPTAFTGPDPQAAPEEFASWLARRHLSSDAVIERIIYLPVGAPENEIRLLEVNRLLNAPPDSDVIEPLDFTPDVADLPFKVLVADVTADQWERIRKGSDPILPPGWELEGNRIFSRS